MEIKLSNFNPDHPLHAKIYEACKAKFHDEVKDLPPAEQELVIRLHTLDLLVSVALKAASVKRRRIEPAGVSPKHEVIDQDRDFYEAVAQYLDVHVWRTPEAMEEAYAQLRR